VIEHPGFFSRQDNNPPRPVGKPLEHAPRSPSHRHLGLCPASDRHQQQPANMKLAQALNPRATHGNTLVMHRSLDGDEHQGRK
jgi:hypothetical protein